MNLKDILAVSGLPGLYKLANSRNNGLLVADLDSDKTRFCSTRKHQFSPMETVAIYTMSDTVELSTIFERMMSQIDENPPAALNAEKSVIEDYFSSIVPDYDEDRVYISDMKKVIKWFNILNEKGYLTAATEEVAEEVAEETTEKKVKAKATTKAKVGVNAKAKMTVKANEKGKAKSKVNMQAKKGG